MENIIYARAITKNLFSEIFGIYDSFDKLNNDANRYMCRNSDIIAIHASEYKLNSNEKPICNYVKYPGRDFIEVT